MRWFFLIPVVLAGIGLASCILYAFLLAYREEGWPFIAFLGLWLWIVAAWVYFDMKREFPPHDR